MPLNQAINQVTYTCGAPWNLDPVIPSIELGWFSVDGHKAPEGMTSPGTNVFAQLHGHKGVD